MPTTQSDFNNPRLHTLYRSGKVPGQLLKGLFQILIDSVPKKFAEIHVALNEKNWEVLIRHPHSLKSSCANLGLDKLSMFWKDLEMLGRSQNFASYQQNYPQAEAEMREALDQLSVAASNFNGWYSGLIKE